jgi:hypothetical protein
MFTRQKHSSLMTKQKCFMTPVLGGRDDVGQEEEAAKVCSAEVDQD